MIPMVTIMTLVTIRTMTTMRTIATMMTILTMMTITSIGGPGGQTVGTRSTFETAAGQQIFLGVAMEICEKWNSYALRPATRKGREIL